MLYLRLSYAELLCTPGWLIETAKIRMHEEGEFNAQQKRNADKKTR